MIDSARPDGAKEGLISPFEISLAPAPPCCSPDLRSVPTSSPALPVEIKYDDRPKGSTESHEHHVGVTVSLTDDRVGVKSPAVRVLLEGDRGVP